MKFLILKTMLNKNAVSNEKRQEKILAELVDHDIGQIYKKPVR
jgi:hypothetical protein